MFIAPNSVGEVIAMIALGIVATIFAFRAGPNMATTMDRVLLVSAGIQFILGGLILALHESYLPWHSQYHASVGVVNWLLLWGGAHIFFAGGIWDFNPERENRQGAVLFLNLVFWIGYMIWIMS